MSHIKWKDYNPPKEHAPDPQLKGKVQAIKLILRKANDTHNDQKRESERSEDRANSFSH